MAKEKRGDGFWETVRTVLYAIIIAGLVRTFLYEPFNIPSGSMIPTLLVGDYLFVSKYSYGYSRYSFPIAVGPRDNRFWNSIPERGDIAVFKLPLDNETDYIKRIIGLPGDRIQVRNGVLFINDEQVQRERVDDFIQEDREGNTRRVRRYMETLPNGTQYYVLDANPSGSLDNTGVYTVPEGHYFAMGDNRDNSTDSRVLNSVGFIPFANLVGRAEIIFYSTNGTARFWEVWKWPITVRFSRLGQLL